MRVIQRGHAYELDHLDGDGKTILQFVFRARHNMGGQQDIEGVTNQEVLRVLIDRIQFLHEQLPHDNNPKILEHLRLALVLHESRALERKVEKGELRPEHVRKAKDGHFELSLYGD